MEDKKKMRDHINLIRKKKREEDRILSYLEEQYKKETSDYVAYLKFLFEDKTDSKSNLWVDFVNKEEDEEDLQVQEEEDSQLHQIFDEDSVNKKKDLDDESSVSSSDMTTDKEEKFEMDLDEDTFNKVKKRIDDYLKYYNEHANDHLKNFLYETKEKEDQLNIADKNELIHKKLLDENSISTSLDSYRYRSNKLNKSKRSNNKNKKGD